MPIPNQHYRIQFASNIPRFFFYTAIKGWGFGLFAALWVIYLQEQRGLSLAALIDVTFFVAAAFGEVPTGIVADTFGRKTSLAIGIALMCVSSLAWVLSPTLPLIMVAYICLGIGFTFLSGAEDALFYESVRLAGRGDDYLRLVGGVGATMTGTLALGSVASGLFASIALPLPFLVAASGYLIIFGIVLNFREPSRNKTADHQTRLSYSEVLHQSFALLHARPTLRYSIIYLSIVPLAALMLETLFVQPQTLALGIPIAGIGVVISFVTAAQRPIVLSNIQTEVSDNMRATLLSMMSLMGTAIAAIAQPTLGLIADEAGLPTTYIVLASCLGILILFLFWTGRHHFPQAAMSS